MRARLIKPGFYKSDELAELPPLARILFSGLWCLSDRAGRLKDRPKAIKAEVLPYDDCDVDAYLDDLADAGFIVRYQSDGGRFIQVVNFGVHQTPHIKEAASTIPAPCSPDTNTMLAPPVPIPIPITVPIPIPVYPSSGVEAKANGHAASDDAGHTPALDELVVIEPEPIADAEPWPDMAWIRTAHDEAWWLVYPRKTHKADSLKAFTARMKRHRTYEAAYADLEQMLEAVVEQSQHWTDPTYTPHSATYIRGERDADEIIVPTGRRERGRSPAEPWPS
jgi:hypothetical protein